MTTAAGDGAVIPEGKTWRGKLSRFREQKMQMQTRNKLGV